MGNSPFENQDLVVRVGEQYYNWKAACPIVMSVLLYGRSFPSEIIDDLGDCIWPGQKKIDPNAPIESNTNEQGFQGSSWWPFGSKGTSDGSIQKTDVNENSDQDLGTAVATAFGATASIEEGIETVDSTLSKEATVTDVEVGEKSVQITTSNDQVDNKSQQMMNEPEAIEMHLPQGFGGDELKIEKDTSTIIDIESHLVTDDQASAEIQKPSSITETLENLPRTPPRTQRLDANVSSSSEASHIDDVLRRENIFGKFKKTLRLSSDSIVSN